MRKLPSLPIVIIVSLSSTIMALIAQNLFGKSLLTVAFGPITAVGLALLIAISAAIRN